VQGILGELMHPLRAHGSTLAELQAQLVSAAARVDVLTQAGATLHAHVDTTQQQQATALDAMDVKLSRTCVQLAALGDWKAEVLAVLRRDSQGAAQRP
jgi:predicted metal-dependent phosphotriesterase family hydrolase